METTNLTELNNLLYDLQEISVKNMTVDAGRKSISRTRRILNALTKPNGLTVEHNSVETPETSHPDSNSEEGLTPPDGLEESRGHSPNDRMLPSDLRFAQLANFLLGIGFNQDNVARMISYRVD